jgi:orotate phosphoribosyltransferase-like protein
MDWLKKNWKCALFAVGTLGVSLLFKKAKDAQDQSKLGELGEKEKKVVNDANDQEVADVVTAGNTRAETITNAHSTATAATAAAKKRRR